MKDIHVFGISTPVGQSFKEVLFKLSSESNIFLYSRKGEPYIKLDLESPDTSILGNFKKKSAIVSFAPIWHITTFFKYLNSFDKNFFENIDSVIVLSSSSVITKRFSTNDYDKNLYSKLIYSENYLTSLSNKLNFKLCIIRPTLIYGKINNYVDQNISKIGKLMKIIPVIFIPKKTGLRQPIHIKQLSEVVFNIYDLLKENKNISYHENIEVGGDNTISYFEMISLIRDNLVKTKIIRYCWIIKIPNKLFYLLTFPIYFISPKFFDSLLRMQVNLSGFTCCSNITNKKPKTFPVENI